jgi:hypothetical protein
MDITLATRLTSTPTRPAQLTGASGAGWEDASDLRIEKPTVTSIHLQATAPFNHQSMVLHNIRINPRIQIKATTRTAMGAAAGAGKHLFSFFIIMENRVPLECEKKFGLTDFGESPRKRILW